MFMCIMLKAYSLISDMWSHLVAGDSWDFNLKFTFSGLLCLLGELSCSLPSKISQWLSALLEARMNQSGDGRGGEKNQLIRREELVTPLSDAHLHRGGLQSTSALPNILGHSLVTLVDPTLLDRFAAAPDGQCTSDIGMARVA